MTESFLHQEAMMASNVKVWDVYENMKGTLEDPGPEGDIVWLRWHPSEHKVVAGCVDSRVWMWGGVTFAHLNTFLGHGDLVTYGNLICIGSEDATLRIWNVECGGGNRVVQGESCI
ncbi:hypothetical protein JHK87_043572 [Glycine soja]|nr:hypothetical protein JHK87_043572 [Glycine soja]